MVAPLVGARIEICMVILRIWETACRSPAGVWIEIIYDDYSAEEIKPLPSWEHGLELVVPAVLHSRR